MSQKIAVIVHQKYDTIEEVDAVKMPEGWNEEDFIKTVCKIYNAHKMDVNIIELDELVTGWTIERKTTLK